MGGMALFKRVVALLISAGLFAVLVAGISADDGNEEAVAEVALKPTQVVADVPEEYNTLFQLQWGGGSLYQLKGRLATMDCMANTIWLYDNNKWNVYNQYDIPQDNFIIQHFLNQYKNNIPATSLWANCYNVCEFGGKQCLSFDEWREQEDNFREYFNVISKVRGEIFIIEDDLFCTQDFHPTIQERILPLLPIRPDTCRILKEDISGIGRGRVSGYAVFFNINAPPFLITIDTMNSKHRGGKEHNDFLLLNAIHELCHINQNYQQVQGLTAEQGFNIDDHTWFKNSPQGKQFIDMVGYIDKGNWLWALPKNSIYRDIYSINPTELSAELCSMYLLDKIGATQRYEYKKWVVSNDSWGHFEPFSPIPNFDVNTYLTPEIREWLEKYVILPDVGD